MLYTSPITDSKTASSLNLWTHLLGLLRQGNNNNNNNYTSDVKLLFQTFICNTALVTDWYGENLPAASSLYSNMVILQLYSKQNPVFKILLCNCKQLKKKGKVLILLTHFWNIVCPHDFKFSYSKNFLLCGPIVRCHQHIKYTIKLHVVLSPMTTN